ncbi:beta-ketoacyl-ACP synthase II [Ethanoligenens harbinense]|uniref:3-oxoacyl-[acyl-carrier-protein] synthase 2 n=1 Tax=Ethanoligenens harbinense (strain DSM 18485 / JCM 12961 / CGMCC 1.5033 / YUAN-3) TaxID=663278 RepID=E6U772_ETHHY|nr:beta-ketoacyl-ACP synthase II [Ethanoligenens harbinense]ADU28142.1 3-oxoacyl-(acyl-carrier-protein) synthase 2 [Ethanoligenens harbinense YUAN-3]AVQ97146.1 beta-ketoacyl-[acyl-carrier-protein] synthase II [Ethanoligenens harbinense YUAN-3]AYF39809.1 beta-ketoacyl-[acyl-carrier-protein] synthase II [Ethanoligenens harbinense]AYF42641.1 beta-ketoacyl-[acyl-carrier-protein] synthase II [Ethanoligenens harbinense]QCN93390.1 beta-ketoacyl-[acyl-carrier-protein] synthase II [Ethanoligenens harbi
MRRVAITGVGVITPVGCTVDTFWENIRAGRHGIAKVENVDMTGQKISLAAQVKDFDPEAYMDKHEARRLDPYARFATAAAVIALADCGTDFADLDPFRVGVMIGSGVGGLQTLESNHSKFVEKGPGRVSALMIPMMIANAASGHVAMRTGFKGVNYATVTACSSSTHAVGEAFHAIRDGYADAAVAGGAEATITPFALGGFANMTALCTSTDPDRASIPFDAERSGFVMGEGGGVLILEEWEHAKARGAKIYAEMVGYATTNDAYHITSPDPEGLGLAKSMEFALKDAGLQPDDIGYINAHGTSTPPNDSTETKAIHTLFGAHADKLCVSSTKSMTGHMLGATGAVEAIVAALSLRDGVVPPTVGYKVKDPVCDLDYVTEGARELDYDYALSNTMGFGGHNATVCLKKFRG